jgi:hypothetical protein
MERAALRPRSLDISQLGFQLLRAPSEVLLCQAKRTATHAHNLTGVMLEEQGGPVQALDHFERAVERAGGREGHDERHAIQSEWSLELCLGKLCEGERSRGSFEQGSK